MSLQFWYMLPVSILIATTAMASGVGGATERGLGVLFLLVAVLTLGEVIL